MCSIVWMYIRLHRAPMKKMQTTGHTFGSSLEGMKSNHIKDWSSGVRGMGSLWCPRWRGAWIVQKILKGGDDRWHGLIHPIVVRCHIDSPNIVVINHGRWSVDPFYGTDLYLTNTKRYCPIADLDEDKPDRKNLKFERCRIVYRPKTRSISDELVRQSKWLERKLHEAWVFSSRLRSVGLN